MLYVNIIREFMETEQDLKELRQKYILDFNRDLRIQLKSKKKDIRSKYGNTVFLEYPIDTIMLSDENVKVNRHKGIVYKED